MTYEQYFDLVKDGLRYYLKSYNLTDEQIIEYMHKEEDVIRERYDLDAKAYASGDITYRQFSEGSVSGVVYTLHMLY